MDPQFSITTDGTIFWVIPKPVLHIGVTFTIGGTGDFNLDIRQGKISGAVNINTEAGAIKGLTDVIIKDNVLDYLPKVGTNLDLGAYFTAGATHPATFKGHFDAMMVISISTDDQILLLVTCVDSDEERRVVAARRLRPEEDEQSLRPLVEQTCLREWTPGAQ